MDFSKENYSQSIIKHYNNLSERKIIIMDLGHRMGILGCSTAEMKMSLGC